MYWKYSFLVSQKCCYFEAGNLTVLETTGIRMGIDPAFFRATLNLLKRDFVSNLTK